MSKDSGSVDSGSVDSGSVDSGSVDSGSLDSGSVDGGSVDSGSVDDGSVDSGPVNSGSGNDSRNSSAAAANTATAAARERGQRRRVWLTVAGVLLFITVIITGFIHRVGQPRLMSSGELQANGLYLMDPPRDFGDFALLDHRGEAFTPVSLQDQWTLVFFGFTNCPDVCPTTMAFLDQFVDQLEGTEAEDTSVVMISVDPARDTVQQLASYVPYFNPQFTGVTGEFLDVFRLATGLNSPFRKAPGQDEEYQVDHSANVVLINPRGHYHGFFKAPLDLAKMKVTYRAARYLWEH